MQIRPQYWLLFLFALVLMPSMVWANPLTIVDVVTPESESEAENAKMSIYFSLRQGSGTPITGINQDNCTVKINDRPAEVVESGMREFISGDLGVGIIFVFPIAKNYAEGAFGIRSTLGTLIQRLDRPIDQLSAVAYDSNAQTQPWSRASDGKLSASIRSMENTEAVEPNLFRSFQPAIALLENLQNVSQKYLVFIGDAEGAVVGDPERAGNFISEFADTLKKNNVKPIIVGYSPDGKEAMTNVSLLERIATNANGISFIAENTTAFQQIITQDVYDYIYKQYIYDATLNMDGKNYLDSGKYNLQLIVKTDKIEEKAAVKISWPELKKNNTWIFITIGGVLLALLLGGGIFLIIARNREPEPTDGPVDTGDVRCAVCGRTIPQQLFGFKGEFCLMPGGLPDCPYYQPPDRGKVQITRGPMADTTFFLKKEITTIGSLTESDIYLSDSTVSRKHAAIKADDGMRYEIRDFGSANGIFINDEKVDRKFLKDGDIIRFGTIETVFKLK